MATAFWNWYHIIGGESVSVMFWMKRAVWILLGIVFVTGISAAKLTSRPYREPQPLTEMKAALDTVRSWDDQMTVVAAYSEKYPRELELQLYALGFQLADNPRQVEAKYAKEASENPNDIAILFLAGRAAQDTAVRLDCAQRILKKDADNYWGLLLTAWYYAGLEPPDFDKAEDHYLKATAADNSLPYTFMDLGKLYQMKGEKEKADEVYVLLSRMMPDDFVPVKLRITLRGAEFGEGLALMQDFLTKHPDNPTALGMEARLQRELKDWPGYIDACRRLLAAQPEGGNAYDLACAFSLGGEVDSAFAALEIASHLGYNDLDQYKEDEDLIPLRDDPRWSDVLVMVETGYSQDLVRMRQQAVATRMERYTKALASRLDEPAPNWTLKGLDGKPVSLAELRGNVVIIDFWATWCGPCRKTMPLLDKFYRMNKRENVKVFGIDVWERKAGPAEIKAYIESKGYNFPILLGDKDIANNYSVRGIPTLFVIDPDGKIAYRHVGYNMSMDEVLTWQVDEILKPRESRE